MDGDTAVGVGLEADEGGEVPLLQNLAGQQLLAGAVRLDHGGAVRGRQSLGLVVVLQGLEAGLRLPHEGVEALLEAHLVGEDVGLLHLHGLLLHGHCVGSGQRTDGLLRVLAGDADATGVFFVVVAAGRSSRDGDLAGDQLGQTTAALLERPGGADRHDFLGGSGTRGMR